MQGWLYDAAGFITVDDDTSYTRDAAGRNVEVSGSSHASYKFDGDGRVLKKVLNRAIPNSTLTTTVYYLNSSMLGRLAVAELNSSGYKGMHGGQASDLTILSRARDIEWFRKA